jgi:hypothetical protein
MPATGLSARRSDHSTAWPARQCRDDNADAAQSADAAIARCRTSRGGHRACPSFANPISKDLIQPQAQIPGPAREAGGREQGHLGKVRRPHRGGHRARNRRGSGSRLRHGADESERAPPAANGCARISWVVPLRVRSATRATADMVTSPSALGTASSCPSRPARGRRRLCADGRPPHSDRRLVCGNRSVSDLIRC